MKVITAAVLGAVVGYLIVAFYFVSLDISLWSAEGRYMAIMLILVGGAIGAMVPSMLQMTEYPD